MDPKHTTPPPPHQSELSPKDPPTNLVTRRHLLRAAAVTAPLVATLPSGAAMAQTSAAQCIAKQQDEADMGNPSGESALGSDTYIRVPATRWTGGQTTYYRFTAYNSDDVTVTDAGDRVAVPEPESGVTDVELLVLYRPVGNPVTGVELSTGTDPAICDIKAGLSGWTNPAPNSPEGAYCIYPVADLGTSPFGNIGMTTSCMTSFVTG